VFCGRPDGLSFEKTTIPVTECGTEKETVAENGTVPVVIQSLSACA
jgi:hypothetical protein